MYLIKVNKNVYRFHLSLIWLNFLKKKKSGLKCVYLRFKKWSSASTRLQELNAQIYHKRPQNGDIKRYSKQKKKYKVHCHSRRAFSYTQNTFWKYFLSKRLKNIFDIWATIKQKNSLKQQYENGYIFLKIKKLCHK